MISVTELRNGIVYEDEGKIYQVLSYEHIKVGRGSATIRLKIRNVRNGSTTIKSFINGARVNNILISKKDLQFLYKDGDAGYFMDPVTFEQLSIPLPNLVGHEYLKEGESFSISFLEREPLVLNLPPKMEFKIAQAGPGVKGNSATNIFKDAVLENGVKTKVPLFVNTGDIIKVDTRTGEYTEKV